MHVIKRIGIGVLIGCSSLAMELSLEQQLINAIQNNQTQEVIGALLERGANPNSCIEGMNAFHMAARMGRTKLIPLLIARGALIDKGAPDYMYASALCFAVYNDYEDTVEALIENGANVNCQLAQVKATPLHIAAMKARPKIAERLIKAGANVHAKNKDNCTPLHSCAEYGRLDFIHFIKIAHDDKKAKRKIELFIPQNLYTATAEVLLDNGAFLEENSMKGTPLHVAARFGQPELVQLFIYRGANLFARRPMTATPLHEAVVGGAGHITNNPNNASAFKLLNAFICTPSKQVRDDAREKAFPLLCCLQKKGYSKDLRKLIMRYFLIEQITENQIQLLKRLLSLNMKFSGHQFTPKGLATAQGNHSKNKNLKKLAEFLDLAQVEQHRAAIYATLKKQLDDHAESSYTFWR